MKAEDNTSFLPSRSAICFLVFPYLAHDPGRRARTKSVAPGVFVRGLRPGLSRVLLSTIAILSPFPDEVFFAHVRERVYVRLSGFC